MSRPFKLNEVPTAAFNLRDEGPLTETALRSRLHGKQPRIANAAATDTRATVDKDPCPLCGSLVEWAYTAKRDTRGKLIRYVYARCRGPERHRWSLQHPGTSAPVHAPHDAIPAPRPSGTAVLGWIDAQLRRLEKEADHLKEMKRIAEGLTKQN